MRREAPALPERTSQRRRRAGNLHLEADRGEKDAAFEWLEKDYEIAGAAGWGEWRLMRDWDNLRGDPRWQEFLHKVGVSDEQLAAIRFEVKVPGAATAL